MTQGIILQGVTVSELEALIKKLIAEGIKELVDKKEQNPYQNDKYLTRYEAANKLNLSLPTLAKYAREGLITSYKIGARVLYKSEDVDKALQVVRNQKYKT